MKVNFKRYKKNAQDSLLVTSILEVTR